MKPVPPPVLLTIAGITLAGWFVTGHESDPRSPGSVLPREAPSPIRSQQTGPLQSAAAATTGTIAVAPDAIRMPPPPTASFAERSVTVGKTRSGAASRPVISLPPPPQLRNYVPVAKGRLAGGRITDDSSADGLTLDLGWESVLPAVMAAPVESNSEENPTVASAVAGTILEEFVAAVSPPTPATPDVQGAPDQVWQDSVRLADERFRAVFGREAFLRQSLQAARVLREAPTTP